MQLTSFPNATVAEYESYDSFDDTAEMIIAEIYARGPIVTGIHGKGIKYCKGGIINDPSLKDLDTTHSVSIIGWGNSWGQYWGEMGFFRVEMGSNLMGIESHLAWATPGRYSSSTWNFPCDEQGSNCKGRGSVSYLDHPSSHIVSFRQGTGTSVAPNPSNKKINNNLGFKYIADEAFTC